MSVDRAEVEAALEKQAAMCDAYDRWMLSSGTDQAEAEFRFIVRLVAAGEDALHTLAAAARAGLESPTTEEVEVAIGRAIGIFSSGGLSNAMYKATDPDDVEGYAVDAADWQTITAAARAWLESPTDAEVEAAAKALRGKAQPSWESTTPEWRGHWRNKARAALEAARRSREADSE